MEIKQKQQKINYYSTNPASMMARHKRNILLEKDYEAVNYKIKCSICNMIIHHNSKNPHNKSEHENKATFIKYKKVI